MNSAIPTETVCPFCKTDLKPEATACAGCGATYAVEKIDPAGGCLFVFGALLVLMGLVYLLDGHDWFGLIPTLVGAGLVWLIIKTIRYKWQKSS